MSAEGVRVTARQTVGNYTASVAGNYLFLALAFATSVLLTRMLGADGFGRLTLVVAVAQTAALFAGFWTHNGFLRYGAEELATRGSLHLVFWGRALVSAPAVLALCVLAWVLRGPIAEFHGTEVGATALGLYFLALVLGQTAQIVFQARGRAGTFAFLQAGERALVLAALLVVAIVAAPGVGAVIAVYVGAGAALLVGSWLVIGWRTLLPPTTSLPTVRRLVTFSWPMLISVVGSYFTSNWLDVAMIRHFLGSAEVGQYAIAYQLMGAVQQLPMVSFPVIVPLLVGAHVARRHESVQLYLDRAVPHAVFAMTVILALATMAGPPLVPTLFGEEFGPSARVLPVLLLAVGWYCIFIAYIPILSVSERTPSILAASAAAAAVNLIGNMLLIPMWGIVGCAWATVLSQAASALIVTWRARLDCRFAPTPVFALLVPLTVVTLGVVSGTWTALAPASVVAVMVFAAVARGLRLGSAADRRVLASLELPGLRWITPEPARGDAA